jgi:hypothetical protein
MHQTRFRSRRARANRPCALAARKVARADAASSRRFVCTRASYCGGPSSRSPSFDGAGWQVVHSPDAFQRPFTAGDGTIGSIFYMANSGQRAPHLAEQDSGHSQPIAQCLWNRFRTRFVRLTLRPNIDSSATFGRGIGITDARFRVGIADALTSLASLMQVGSRRYCTTQGARPTSELNVTE